MRAPLLTGQPAPVIPFTVLAGRKPEPEELSLEAKARLLQAKSPILAGVVEHLVDKFLEDSEDDGDPAAGDNPGA